MKPVLTADAMEQFKADISRQTPEPEETAPAKPGVEETPPSSPTPPAGTKVETAAAVAGVEQLQKRITELEAQGDQAGQERAIAILEQIAKENPGLADAIYGRQTQTPTAAKPAEDPSAAIMKRLEQLEARHYHEQLQDAKEALLDKLETHMDKYEKIYLHDLYGEMAQRALGEMVAANPGGNLAHMTEQIAKKFQAIEEGIKSQYTQGKKQAAKTVAPGAGPAGGAVPGPGPTKLKLGDGPGGTKQALAKWMAAQAAEES